MRTLEDSRARWLVTSNHVTSLPNLRKSIKLEGDDNPTTSGLRSVCWKTFLLFQSTEKSQWPQILEDARSAYTSLRDHLLRFIDNPNELGSSLDPLDDNNDSPWNTLRQDEEIRAEIFQDVERCMPEEPYFRQTETQRMLLDILFVFCKINQDVGYRQGMHELLAPILWVIEQDAIDTEEIGLQTPDSDGLMRQTLDRRYIEHDAFTLLALVMRSAKSFYELAEPDRRASAYSTGSSTPQQGASPIVERSQRIHEVYLTQLDPELAKHLTDIEILPQIFLIRWIRLIFGREFPFDDLLDLWDVLFAEDPQLDLVDMICVAMLLRIRWQLLDANYSFALMLLLKYPAPSHPTGPKSFVEDAIFLRDNFSDVGGAEIIEKYSGKAPSPPNPSLAPSPALGQAVRPSSGLSRTRSPLASPARFLQQQGVGDLFQGAAKGLFDRGERLGINQAVRDAVGEARKNMQGLQASRSNSTKGRTSNQPARWSLDEGRLVQPSRASVSAMTARNRQLAAMLDQAMSNLRAASTSKDEDKEVYLKAMDLAIARVDFVKVYLEDSSMPLPKEPKPDNSQSQQSTSKTVDPPPQNQPPQTTTHPKSANPSPSIKATAPTTTSSPPPSDTLPPAQPPATTTSSSTPQPPKLQSSTNAATTTTAAASLPNLHEANSTPGPDPRPDANNNNSKVSDVADANKPLLPLPRPSAPLPTRSTIAQSNFAWMLEPEEGTAFGSSSSSGGAHSSSASPFNKSKRDRGRRPTSGVSREKAAFLFGEDGDGDGEGEGNGQDGGGGGGGGGGAEVDGMFDMGLLRGQGKGGSS